MVWLAELANDIKLLKYLVGAKDKGEYPYFSKAVEDLNGQMNPFEVSKNLDKLYDLGLVDPSGRSV